MAVCRYMVTCPKWPECRHGGFTARDTLLPGSHRASPGVLPSVHGVSGHTETGCIPHHGHGVLGTASVLALWSVVCVCEAGVGGGCSGVCCVRAAVCVVCWWCVWVPVLASLGLVWQLCVGAGAVFHGPSPALAAGPGCGSLPLRARVCWWCCVPLPPPLRALPPLSLCRVAWSAVPLVPCPGLPGLWWVGGGGSLTLARLPSPGVSPWGGRCLHSPSGCNSVERAVHLYPLGTNGPAP